MVRINPSLWIYSLLLFSTAVWAQPPESEADTIYDPYQSVNRAIFSFNHTLDRYTLKLVAKAYKAVTPKVVNQGITNFLTNLRLPITIINDGLQG